MDLCLCALRDLVQACLGMEWHRGGGRVDAVALVEQVTVEAGGIGCGVHCVHFVLREVRDVDW